MSRWPPQDPVVDELVGDMASLHPNHIRILSIQGQQYPSIQHAYQCAKTQDEAWRLRILATPSPYEAWEVGRAAPLLKPAEWDTLRVAAMSKIVTAKVLQHREVREALLSSAPKYIFHGFWNEAEEDTFWGVCLRTGEGHNVYGEMLVTLRKILLQKQESAAKQQTL